MSRLSSAADQAMKEPVVRVADFCFLAFDDPVYAHNGVGDIQFGGNTWLGVGDLGGVDAVTEDGSIGPAPIRISLSGIPSDLVSDLNAQNFRGRSAQLYLGLFDENWQLIQDPEIYWQGIVDTCAVELGENSAGVTVNCEKREFQMLRRVNQRLYTNENQQRLHTGDLFFDRLVQSFEQRISWGGLVIYPDLTGRDSQPRLPR